MIIPFIRNKLLIDGEKAPVKGALSLFVFVNERQDNQYPYHDKAYYHANRFYWIHAIPHFVSHITKLRIDPQQHTSCLEYAPYNERVKNTI